MARKDTDPMMPVVRTAPQDTDPSYVPPVEAHVSGPALGEGDAGVVDRMLRGLSRERKPPKIPVAVAADSDGKDAAAFYAPAGKPSARNLTGEAQPAVVLNVTAPMPPLHAGAQARAPGGASDATRTTVPGLRARWVTLRARSLALGAVGLFLSGAAAGFIARGWQATSPSSPVAATESALPLLAISSSASLISEEPAAPPATIATVATVAVVARASPGATAPREPSPEDPVVARAPEPSRAGPRAAPPPSARASSGHAATAAPTPKSSATAAPAAPTATHDVSHEM